MDHALAHSTKLKFATQSSVPVRQFKFYEKMAKHIHKNYSHDVMNIPYQFCSLRYCSLKFTASGMRLETGIRVMLLAAVGQHSEKEP